MSRSELQGTPWHETYITSGKNSYNCYYRNSHTHKCKFSKRKNLYCVGKNECDYYVSKAHVSTSTKKEKIDYLATDSCCFSEDDGTCNLEGYINNGKRCIKPGLCAKFSIKNKYKNPIDNKFNHFNISVISTQKMVKEIPQINTLRKIDTKKGCPFCHKKFIYSKVFCPDNIVLKCYECKKCNKFFYDYSSAQKLCCLASKKHKKLDWNKVYAFKTKL